MSQFETVFTWICEKTEKKGENDLTGKLSTGWRIFLYAAICIIAGMNAGYIQYQNCRRDEYTGREAVIHGCLYGAVWMEVTAYVMFVQLLPLTQ